MSVSGGYSDLGQRHGLKNNQLPIQSDKKSAKRTNNLQAFVFYC